MRRSSIQDLALATAIALPGCYMGAQSDPDGAESGGSATSGVGEAGGVDETGAGSGGPQDPPPELGIGPMGMRRLTRAEFDNTVFDLLGDDTRPGSTGLPEDKRSPFDNDFPGQNASQILVEGLEAIATGIADRLVDDGPRLASVLGCSPSVPEDAICMESFVRAFGRRALRRPLADDEVADFAGLGLAAAGEASDFNAGVKLVVRALLQDAEFVYRVERGTELEDRPGVFRLSNFEIAARMSYLAWGSTPDDALLDDAEARMLGTSSGRRSAFERMLDDPRARRQVDRFHALWLGYDQLPHDPALTAAMRQETAALVERVVLDERTSWLDLLTAGETFIDEALAEHYGLPAPGGSGPAWVAYGESGRMGILSHGSFLSTAANPDDTSPTKRGKLIRERLMCEEIPDPPDDVMADAAPSEGECKIDRYEAHRSEPACAGCHALVDPIGFGLENYDRAGRWRATDDDAPQCEIEGQGELTGVGTFSGPAELAQRLIDADVLQACAVEQLYRYAMGRQLEADDEPYVTELGAAFADSEYRMHQMFIELVANPAFGFRTQEQQ